jgi:rubrerythrin
MVSLATIVLIYSRLGCVDRGTRMDGAQRELSVAVLRTALAIEEFGIKFYSDLSECVTDDVGKALMRSLGKDEEEHARIIRKEMARVTEGHPVAGPEPMKEYLDILPSKVFVKPEGSCLTLEEEVAALQKGVDVEINSIKMYRDALSRAIDPNTKATLEELARWETRHREILEENMRTLRAEGSWYGYGPILEG